MDKFIYFNDMHYGSNPVSRKDNYNSSLLSKLSFILKLARKNNCTVLNGGDLFDKPNIKMIDMLRLMSLLNDFSDVRIISLRGNDNHDGHIEHSPLKLLELAGLIETSDGKQFVEFPETRIYFADNNTEPNNIEMIDDDKLKILMTHHIIVENPVIFKHYLIDDIKTDADIVLLADYHPRQGIITRDDNVVFVSIGALSRRKHTAHEIGRIPKCIYIKSDGKMKEIDVPCQQDIWANMDKIEQINKVETKEEVKSMIKLIDDEELFDAKIEHMLEAFGKTMNLNQKTMEYILTEMEKI